MKTKRLKAPAFPSPAEVAQLKRALTKAEARAERVTAALCCEAAIQAEAAVPSKVAAIDKIVKVGGLSFRVTRAFNSPDVYTEEVSG
jgi:hypothetical protein